MKGEDRTSEQSPSLLVRVPHSSSFGGDAVVESDEEFYDADVFFDEHSIGSSQEEITEVPTGYLQHSIVPSISDNNSEGDDEGLLQQQHRQQQPLVETVLDGLGSLSAPDDAVIHENEGSEMKPTASCSSDTVATKESTESKDVHGQNGHGNCHQPENTDGPKNDRVNGTSASQAISMSGKPVFRTYLHSQGGEERGSNRSIILTQDQSPSRRLRMMKKRWDSTKRENLANLGGSDAESSDNDSDSSSSSSSGSSSCSSSSKNSYDASTDTGNRENNKDSFLLQSKHAAQSNSRRSMLECARQSSGRRIQSLLAFKEGSKSSRNNIAEHENHITPRTVRQSRRIDLETRVKSMREFTAQKVTDPEYFQPMDPRKRRKTIFLRKQKEKLAEEATNAANALGLPNVKGRSTFYLRPSGGLECEELEEIEVPPKQYRLRSMIETVRRNQTIKPR
jgi:hypothetical protein